MVAIRLAAFGGMVPGMDDRLIPDNNAAYALNAWLYSGALQGIHTQTLIYTPVSADTRRVFRIPVQYYDKEHIADSYWMEFDDADTDVIRTPLTGDSYQRYYWASPSEPPGYNTLSRIAAGSAGYLLGIPTPATAPTVVPGGGVSATLESRAYAYTWVSTYGEEGPPSPPTVTTGKVDDTWALTLTAPTLADTTGRSLATVRIYRTVTATSGITTYFFVAEQAIATLTYNDTSSSATVAENNQLESTEWSGPPSDLQGMISMPNGMVAGFRENEVWFCEPYRLHAWPAGYTINVSYPIVGLGVVGQTLVICTTGYPHAATGVTPSAMTLSRLPMLAPCMSRGSIVSSQFGVYYASADGIALAAYGSIAIVSKTLITKDRWQELLYLRLLRSAMIGGAYYTNGGLSAGLFEPTAYEDAAFEVTDYTAARTGAMVDLSDNRVAWTQIEDTGPVVNVMTDTWTGEVFIVRDGGVYHLDISPTNTRRPYLWRSKVFQPTERKNLEAMRIWFDLPDGVTTPTQPVNTDQDQIYDPNTQLGVVRVFADGVREYVAEIRTSGELMRLPSGFQATFWQFEIEAKVRIYSLEAATSAKELMNV